MMEQRVVFVLLCCMLILVVGEKQCQKGRECISFERCSEFEAYIGQSSQTWPPFVKNNIKTLFCGIEEGEARKIYKVCCEPNTGLALLNLEQCGLNNWSRLLRGRIATLFEYPWITLLGGSSGAFHCAGSLIAENFVLTAAHCNEVKIEFARLGELDQSNPIDCYQMSSELDCAEPHQDISVEQFIQHPNYSTISKKNDIALVKLVRSAKLNENVRPICLPLPQLTPQKLPTTMRIAGWGYFSGSTDSSTVMRFAQVPLIENQQCNDSLSLLPGNLTVDDSEVCTGVADICPVDSGGPLQYVGHNRIIIHGVASKITASCDVESAPEVFASVTHFMDWIIENLK